jgi:predicted NodU family carbamoyl transferase
VPALRILGLSAFYHDSAAALVEDGRIVAAAQEERFTRKKHDADLPRGAIEYCLDQAGIELAEVDYVAFYDKPFLKFERLLETYLAARVSVVPDGDPLVAAREAVSEATLARRVAPARAER